MSLKSRWNRAGNVQWDDHEAVVIFDQYGNPVKVKKWLQWARFVKGDKPHQPKRADSQLLRGGRWGQGRKK